MSSTAGKVVGESPLSLSNHPHSYKSEWTVSQSFKGKLMKDSKILCWFKGSIAFASTKEPIKDLKLSQSHWHPSILITLEALTIFKMRVIMAWMKVREGCERSIWLYKRTRVLLKILNHLMLLAQITHHLFAMSKCQILGRIKSSAYSQKRFKTQIQMTVIDLSSLSRNSKASFSQKVTKRIS